MSSINVTLPKLHVFFRSDKTAEEIRGKAMGSLADCYETEIQTLISPVRSLASETVRSLGKVYPDRDRWTVYLKGIVKGDTALTEQQILEAWEGDHDNIKKVLRDCLEMPDFAATDITFEFKRLDGREAEEEA